HASFCGLSLCTALRAQLTDSGSGTIAGIPANYTEAKAGGYSLPDRSSSPGNRTQRKVRFRKRTPFAAMSF
ncbi:MAG: hypothetical protein ABIZ49_12695, partial [Opitutaceae bacterium]